MINRQIDMFMIMALIMLLTLQEQLKIFLL